MCCLQKVRWKRQCSRMLGVDGRLNTLWWSERQDGVGGMGVVATELFEKLLCWFLKRMCRG